MTRDSDEERTTPDEGSNNEPPLAELAALEIEPSDAFLDVVHQKIDRRIVASHFLTVGWSGFAIVFMQYLKLIFQTLFPGAASDGDRP